jgi:hypothetical protein
MDKSERVSAAAEWYASNPYVRAAVSGVASLVPIGGAAVDAWLGTKGSALAERRRDALIAELHNLLARLSEDKVDKEYFQSEAWADLLMQAIQSSTRTGDTEKIRLFAAILAGAATIDGPVDLDMEAVLGTLADLTPVEIGIAGQMYDAIRQEPHVFIDGCPAPNVPDADFHMKRLEAAGLVAARQPMGMTFQHMENYHLTPTFHRIIAALRNVAYEPSGTAAEATDNPGPMEADQ